MNPTDTLEVPVSFDRVDGALDFLDDELVLAVGLVSATAVNYAPSVYDAGNDFIQVGLTFVSASKTEITTQNYNMQGDFMQVAVGYVSNSIIEYYHVRYDNFQDDMLQVGVSLVSASATGV